jgi:hypothetical protein
MHQITSNSVDASQENSYNIVNCKSTTTCIGEEETFTACDNVQEVEDTALNGPDPIVDSVADSLQEAAITQVNNGYKKNSVVGQTPSPDQRGVFISGYDFQVSRVC